MTRPTMPGTAHAGSEWPARLRESLEWSRAHGATFNVAWHLALADCPMPEHEEWTKGTKNGKRSGLQSGEEPTVEFMRRHFEAAYEGRSGSVGTFRPEPPVATPDGLSVAHNGPQTPSDHAPRCRSGDGCDREATRGQFGKWWCEEHGAELERIAAMPGDPRTEAFRAQSELARTRVRRAAA